MCFVAVNFTASAKITLPALVGDNMVLQQQTEVNLWGKADPSSKVTVKTSWNSKSYSTKATAEGDWEIKVSTPKAGGPYSITISDGDKITLSNVLIGEVWICSGQSNMEMPLSGFNREPVNGGPEAILKAAQNKGMRFFTVEKAMSKKHVKEVKGAWMEATPEALASFSATAYFFGKNLYDALDIPIGLISTNWGGTRIEAWMSEDAAKKVNGNIVATDAKQWDPNKVSVLYNAMLEPVSNYTAQGFIWYQGESNRDNASDYSANMKEMIALWRNLWNDQQMPFYFVQLAPHNYDDPKGISTPLVIEQQIKALDIIPLTGMAATTDIGEGVSIHPSQKDMVGFRLASLALADTYGQKGIVANSPRMESVDYDQSFAIVKFNTPTALTTKFQPLLGFEIAGADRKFYPAQARITGDREVRVSSYMVAEPVAVRYAFRNNPEATLYNTSMLAAFPFRTDDWNDVK